MMKAQLVVIYKRLLMQNPYNVIKIIKVIKKKKI